MLLILENLFLWLRLLRGTAESREVERFTNGLVQEHHNDRFKFEIVDSLEISGWLDERPEAEQRHEAELEEFAEVVA